MRKPSTLAEYRVAYERVCDKLADAQSVMVACGCAPKYTAIRDEKSVAARRAGKRGRRS